MKDEYSMKSGTVSSGIKLFFLGFITLFLELALIRYLAGNIWNLGFFPNMVLISVFIGMGTGFVFHHYVSDRLSHVIFQASAFVLLFLIGFVYFKHPVMPGFDAWSGEIGGELFFSANKIETGLHGYIPIIVSFLTVIIIFSFISQRTAKLFRLFHPLKAYTLDIAGSCCGILCFMCISWFKLPAMIWFIILVPLFLCAMGDSWKTRWVPLIPLVAVIFIAGSDDIRALLKPGFIKNVEVRWSPYQKVELLFAPKGARWVFVNGIEHQSILYEPELSEALYNIPFNERYKAADLPPYKNILVIGSGSGNDVAVALRHGAKYIDAVEIDPVIAGIGKKYHPDNPYGQPGVHLHVNDGRAFMTNTTRKYDLIIFALTDSLVKVSPMAQLRLENYLFTRESVERAFNLLTDTGDVVFYNYYRKPWIVRKIQKMMHEATGIFPVNLSPQEQFTILRAGRNDKPAALSFMESAQWRNTPVPTDDWPFLYLKDITIPGVYIKAMIAMAVIIFLLMTFLHRSTKKLESFRDGAQSLSIKLAFLFMGIAFLLLETKSVVQFSLLFGTTWLNNSLVFLAVLVLVLAANWTAYGIRGKHTLWIIFLLLIVSSLATLVYPLANLLHVRTFFLRFLIASIMTFSPIFFANLIFSMTFREQKIAEHIFGWNLIGATLGGVIEYTSMAVGYNALAVIVAVCYTLVFIMIMIGRRTSPA